jgi:hypothetical protein
VIAVCAITLALSIIASLPLAVFDNYWVGLVNKTTRNLLAKSRAALSEPSTGEVQ